VIVNKEGSWTYNLVDPFRILAAAAEAAASERVGGLCLRNSNRYGAGISVVITQIRGNGLARQHGRLLDGTTWWILSGSILAAAASSQHLKGRCAVTRCYACSGIGIVELSPKCRATGCSSQHGRVLDSTNLVDPFGILAAAAEAAI
jgi:hypothetical protein